MLSGFDEWFTARGQGVLAFTKSACLPLLGVYRADQPKNHACDAHNETVLTKIEAHPDIDHLILAGRWALNVEGQRAAHEQGQPALLAETGMPTAGIENNAQLVSKGLERLVARLDSRGISVTIIAGIPEIGWDVPDLVLASGFKGSVDGFAPDLDSYKSRNARANKILERVSTEFGAKLINPADTLCNSVCQIQLGGVPIYRDDDHLSDFGARWLIPKLMGTLSEVADR